MHRVFVHSASYEDCRSAVAKAFDLFNPELNGRKVLIKPNVLRSSAPEDGIVTHPSILRAVVEEVEKRKPSQIVVGDNPGVQSYGANEEAFEQTGLAGAAGKYYQNIGMDSVPMPLKTSGFDATAMVSRAVMDADVVISLPKFKTHGLTVVTGAIKNSYGILPGAQKARLHLAAGSPRGFHETVVDVFKLRIPDLFIMDAVVGMEGNGPTSPYLRPIGCVIAADNAVAMDAVVARMMGLEPGKLRFLQKAAEEGLGNFDADQIEVIGQTPTLNGFKLPPLGGEAIADNKQMQAFICSRTQLQPKIDPERCTGCGTCVAQCPAGALSMGDDLPQVDEQACITCFCCQEMCPEQALALA